MQKLAQKTAIITGSDSGIGQVTAVEFAREGANVVIVYHTDPPGAEHTRERVEEVGGRALVLQADLGDPGQAETLFKQAVEAFGSIDILVNSAGTNSAHKTRGRDGTRGVRGDGAHQPFPSFPPLPIIRPSPEGTMGARSLM